MKRLLIYLTYDKQKIIDDYIGYFLHSMRKLTETIVVVCNMPYIQKGIHNISDYADQIVYRENKGLDCGGFKDALCQFVGWENLKKYDELILVNDSFYGPFEDIGQIFSEMESRRLDFWGLMKRGNGAYGMTGSDPEHILSFFYVFQSPLIYSKDFQMYWEEMPYYRDYMTVVKQYERKLTKYFSDLGYHYDAYADTEPNESSNPKNQFFQCDYLSYEMITKRKFPFLKRKQLSYNPLFMQTQENLALSIAYVEQHTNYDVNLIWKNLIRVMNPAELYRSLGLQFVLNDAKFISEKNRGKNKIVEQVQILVCAEWMNCVDSVTEYLKTISGFCNVQIYSKKDSILKQYQERGFSVNYFEGTDIELLSLVKLDEYRYLCLLHDFDLSSEQFPSCTGKSYFFNVWENLVKDILHLCEILCLFETKPYLGMLLHPVPLFGQWIGELGWNWEERYEEVSKYCKELGLNTVMDRDISPIHVTNNFWIRTEILQSFFQKLNVGRGSKVLSQDKINYLWSAIVQDYGQLTGIVESSFYASMNEVNYHYYFRTLMEWLSRRYGHYQKFYEYKEIFRADEIVERCRKAHKGFYVYGTGEIAERCFSWIKETKAFIVSDGQAKATSFLGKPVIYLSEFPEMQGYGIILCLSKENQTNVIELLKEKGIRDYYTLY